MKVGNDLAAAVIAAGLFFLPALSSTAYAAPQPQQQGEVSFVSGGVGEGELQEIKSLSSEYPVQFLFVTQGTPNEYLSDVKVRVTDKSGKTVLDTTANGPYFLAKLPTGSYTVMADHDGNVKRQTFQAGGKKSQRLTFVWNK